MVQLLELKAQDHQVARGIPKEADTFTRDDTDIGDVDTRKMNIKLKDQLPVQKNCDHIQSHSTKKLRIF